MTSFQYLLPICAISHESWLAFIQDQHYKIPASTNNQMHKKMTILISQLAVSLDFSAIDLTAQKRWKSRLTGSWIHEQTTGHTPSQYCMLNCHTHSWHLAFFDFRAWHILGLDGPLLEAGFYLRKYRISFMVCLNWYSPLLITMGNACKWVNCHP